MKHDPLCRRKNISEVLMEGCPECQLIKRAKIDAVVELLGGISLEEHDHRIITKNYEQGRVDERKRWINPDCVWGEGECVPNCPSCKRMDALYAERYEGAKEVLEEHHKDRCCSICDTHVMPHRGCILR